MVRPVRATAKTVTIPSPVGGWNARDSLSEMAPTDAVSLTNWFPLTTECMLRLGYTEHATGLPSQVESLLPYSGGSTEELWAVSNGAFYDATSQGPIGAPAVSGLANSRWQWANIATAGGNFLYVANGINTPYLYNGTTWTSITGISTPAITGVTTTTLNNPILFKSRVWFIQTNTLKTWYLPPDSVGGAANPVDVSAIATKGGYIVDHATWTIDAGQGVDDYYAMVTSMGQVIIYQGSDPSSSTTWALKGVWNLGQPVGNRCLYKLAGDIMYISQDGLIPLGESLQSSRVNPRVALTDKIQYATSSAISLYGSNFGWKTLYFARQNMLIMNVPVEEGANQQQYVMNTITKSWCNFTGWQANCWELFNDSPFFGGNGVVCQAWNSNADNGLNIDANTLQAFNNFKNSLQKRFTMMQPVFRSDGTPGILASLNIDFSTEVNNSSLSFSPVTVGLWDSALWDAGMWGGALSVIQNWQGVNGIGRYAGIQMQLSSAGIDTRWVSTTLVYETGGIL